MTVHQKVSLTVVPLSGPLKTNDFSNPGGRAFDRLHSEKSPSTSTTSDQVAQTLVNQKILEQLTTIGKRLDALENNKCKKSADKSKIKNKKGKVSEHKVPMSAHAQSADTKCKYRAISNQYTNKYTIFALIELYQAKCEYSATSGSENT